MAPQFNNRTLYHHSRSDWLRRDFMSWLWCEWIIFSGKNIVWFSLWRRSAALFGLWFRNFPDEKKALFESLLLRGLWADAKCTRARSWWTQAGVGYCVPSHLGHIQNLLLIFSRLCLQGAPGRAEPTAKHPAAWGGTMNTESRTLLGTYSPPDGCTWNKEIRRSKKQSASWLWNVPICKLCLGCLIRTKQSQGKKNPLSGVLTRLWDGLNKRRVMLWWVTWRRWADFVDFLQSGAGCFLLFPVLVSHCCSSIHLFYSSTYFPESQHYCLIWCSGLDLVHITAMNTRSTRINEA